MIPFYQPAVAVPPDALEGLLEIATRKIVSAALSGVARFRIYTLPNRHHRALACSITTVKCRDKIPGVPRYRAEFERDYRYRSFSWKDY